MVANMRLKMSTISSGDTREKRREANALRFQPAISAHTAEIACMSPIILFPETTGNALPLLLFNSYMCCRYPSSAFGSNSKRKEEAEDD